MQEKGLAIETPEEQFTVHPAASTMEDYMGAPDVIFVCLKGYSLEDAVPFLRRVTGKDTVVIPILNIYGTGGRLQKELPDTTVTDGCMYIVSEIKEPGIIRMNGRLFRVVYGLRRDAAADLRERVMPVLEQVKADLEQAKIRAVLSEKIEADALRKFTLISPMAAIGSAYGTTVRELQEGGAYRATFQNLIRELMAMAEKQQIPLPKDMAEKNLATVDAMAPDSTASMQRDVAAGKPSEADGLVYQVVRTAKSLGVPVPEYEKIAADLRQRIGR